MASFRTIFCNILVDSVMMGCLGVDDSVCECDVTTKKSGTDVLCRLRRGNLGF